MSLIQFQTEDNNLGALVVVVRNETIRYINDKTKIKWSWAPVGQKDSNIIFG